MKRRNMTNIDLRLLTIVNELNKTRSVSQAAENLELSQSAVSMSLARLRKHFKDPLFVRTPDGMEPTPQMTRIDRAAGEGGRLAGNGAGPSDRVSPGYFGPHRFGWAPPISRALRYCRR